MVRTDLPGYVFLREFVDVSLGLLARLWIRLFGTQRVVVLAYHSISQSDWIHAIPPAIFRTQLKWLSQNAEVVGLERAERAISSSFCSPRISVALTFDDGYGDWVTEALPALTEVGLTATFFVTTSFASVTSVPHNNLELLRAEDVQTLASAKQIIGSHSQTHRDLSTCSEEEFRQEVHASCSMLRTLSGQQVRYLSYPKGRYTPHYFPILRAEGIALALAGHGSVGPQVEPFAAPRVPVTKPISLRRFIARIYRAAAWGAF